MKIIGHRGARGEAPENTLASFVHAYQQGIRHFELDVRLSKDGKLVVIHDKTTDRTTGLSGSVAELSISELTAMDAARHIPPWPEPAHIPTLPNVIDACQDFQSIQFEVKSDSKIRLNTLCNRLVELIQQRDLYARAVVTSSNTWVLQQFKRLNSSVTTGYVAVNRFPNPVQTALKYNCKLLVLNYKLADETVVRACSAAGLKLSCWTVNTLPEIQTLQALGVESVITDYPCLVFNYYQQQTNLHVE
jgi:glycerophosphoryl diester phosphodiesterase